MENHDVEPCRCVAKKKSQVFYDYPGRRLCQIEILVQAIKLVSVQDTVDVRSQDSENIASMM